MYNCIVVHNYLQFIPVQPTPIEPDMMSPVTHFVIYYGRDETALMNYTTTHTEPTRYNMSGWSEKGAWLVGVASGWCGAKASYTQISK